ncbi:MAG: hypothetical protein ACKVOB_10020 [Sphingomonas sp.]
MKVGWRRRLLAFAVAALSASAACALVLGVVVGIETTQNLGGWLAGLGASFLLCLIFVTAGGLGFGLIIDRLIPRGTSRLVFHAVAAGSGSIAAIALMRVVWRIPTIWTVPAIGALAGLVAAAVWWKMVRAKERVANG